MRRANVFVYDECINRDIPFPELPVFLSEHYGQCAEDLIVASLLLAWSSRAGIALSCQRYLEIGGNHPIATSATYLLNRRFGMRGVIVEANPALIDTLQQNRPDDLILSGAVQTEALDTVAFSVSKHNEVSSLDRSFVLAWRGGTVGERALINVPALRINALLEKHFPQAGPAYLSLDVEGVDLQILQDMDFDRFRPVIVQAEPSDQYVPGNSRRIQEFMNSKRYLLVAQTEVNLIFMAAECVAVDAIEKGPSPPAVSQSATAAIKSQLETARDEIRRLRQELAARTSKLESSETIVRMLQESWSWKLTAPLRAIKRALTGG